MREIFFNITGTVLVLNVMFLLIPDGKFEKYVRFIAGLIVILTIIGNIINIKLDHAVLQFDESDISYQSNEELEQSVKTDLIEETLEERIANELGISVDIEAEINGNKFNGIVILGAKEKIEEIKDTIIQYCDINRDNIMIK